MSLRHTTRGNRLWLTVFIISLVLLATSLAWAQDLRIIYLNDLHGWVASPPQGPDGERLGGAATLAARVKELRQGQPSLFLAAGDMIEGSSWTNFFKGRSTIALLNLMALDAMVVGNHEFYFGVPELQARIREAKFPILGANVTGIPELKPFIIKEVSGLKVAIIGLVTPHTAKIRTFHLPRTVHFLSARKTLEKFLPQLRSQADLIIVLSHLGFPADLRLAAEIAGIDVIVGGHSHTRLLEPRTVGHTLIVQAWEHGKALGVLDLQVHQGRIVHSQGRLEDNLTAVGPGDEAVQRLVADYQSRVDEVLGQIIGETTVFLDGKNVRRRETNLGDWLADLIRRTAGADIALINAGAIRRSLPAGPIRLKDIEEIIPFDNYIVTLKLTGREVRQVLEHGLAKLPQASAGFPQVSGLSLRYDLSAPSGQRLRQVQVGGQPLVADKTYSLATVDFLAAGGDGYSMLPKIFRGLDQTGPQGRYPKGKLVSNDPGTPLKQMVSDYVRSQKTISPVLEGRITPDD